MSKKKVLVLASTFPRWKNDTTPPFVFELEKRLAHDFDIYVLAPHFKGAKKYEESEGLKIYRYQYFWPASWQKLCYEGGILPNMKKNKLLILQGFTLVLFQILASIKLVRKEKIDLIHAHWIVPQGITALVIKRLFSIPYIITTHGGDIYGLQNRLFINIKKTILKNAQYITVVSTAIRDEIIQNIDHSLDVHVISMGVDANLFNPKKYDKELKKKFNVKGPLLLFVGRLAEKKGVKYLIEAMPELIKEFPSIKLFVIGEGPLNGQIKNLITKSNLDNNIILIGALPYQELPAYYASSDIFIGPSIRIKEGDTEGLGLTFVEASLSGCVPIGTKVGGISDVIENGQTGYLVNQRNSKELTKVIKKLLGNKKKFKEIKEKATLHALSKFEWKIVRNKYGEIYSQNI